jgi:hypothetical protein
VLFQFSAITKAQTKLDTLDLIKLYVDSVKLKKIDKMPCFDGHVWGTRRYSEFPPHISSCGIITETTAWTKKQRIDRTYIIRRDGKICYYSEKRTKNIGKAYIITHNEKKDNKNIEKVRKQLDELMVSPPCLEVYFYDGKILDYNINSTGNGEIYNLNPYKRSKKLTEEDIKKIIKKGGDFGGINQIIQWKYKNIDD